MPSKLFVNLPVKDLPASKAFFEALGFAFDLRYTDENAACMVVGESSFVMLLTEDFFTAFTGRALADTWAATGVIVAVSQDTAEAVDRIGAAAVAAGGTAAEATQEASPMYTRAFHDPDGHLWEIFHIPPNPARGRRPAAVPGATGHPRGRRDGCRAWQGATAAAGSFRARHGGK